MRSNGNIADSTINFMPVHRMSSDSKSLELNIDGALLRKVHIKAEGFYMYSIKVVPEEFYMFVSNSAVTKVDGKNHKILLLPGQYFILSESEETSYRFFINHTEQNDDIFFIRLNREKFKTFTESIALNKQMSMDVNMVNILSSMFDCSYENEIKSAFLQAKIIELLCSIEHQINELNKNIETFEVPAHMIEPIKLAREIMISNLKEPLSLAGLARQAGTNENYLKKYFKLIFGQTVFGFLNDYKMQMAKKMLTKDKMPISQVAADLGYKNSSNFSANFFKYYGFLPKKFKAGKLYLLFILEDLIVAFEELVLAIVC
ncbi:AraC family transcriptional regulator [Pedobacter chinensis]|uniref:AraC family transcriptional regulator n=1 Tax=Pedobacter chinensis TaxID=2282421 RepID=A0A369PY72_9SPHI|nr:AraC family transcriptional regulator [Pedobacter chinensis]RDC56165.1 AraC family transcriptional regulator [Pedobacter chinensis]